MLQATDVTDKVGGNKLIVGFVQSNSSLALPRWQKIPRYRDGDSSVATSRTQLRYRSQMEGKVGCHTTTDGFKHRRNVLCRVCVVGGNAEQSGSGQPMAHSQVEGYI